MSDSELNKAAVELLNKHQDVYELKRGRDVTKTVIRFILVQLAISSDTP